MPARSTGVIAVVVVPLPSWNWPLKPQQRTVPSGFIAQVLSSLAATCRIPTFAHALVPVTEQVPAPTVHVVDVGGAQVLQSP